MIETKSRVFVDGALIGLTDDPKGLVQKVRAMRRQGVISTELNCSHKEFNGDVIIHTDRGRARRPLIVLQDGKPMVSDDDLQKLKNKEIVFFDLITKGVIELVDAEEEEDLFIAIRPEDLTPLHTHLEIDASLILGIGAAHVPFPEHNASPRVTMGAGMVKQALGFANANMKLRPDTRGHQLHYVQKPLVHTQTSEIIGSDDRAAGQNYVVAILSYEGYNIEDALIFNKGSIDRGLGRSHFYRTYEGEERRYPGGQIDRIQVPDEDVVGSHGTDYYAYLDDDGIINPETVVKEKDVIIGKTSPPRFLEEPTSELITVEKRRDTSVTMRSNEHGIVDTVILTEGENNSKLVKVRTRDLRIPEVGDKFASRHGQKGVIGLSAGAIVISGLSYVLRRKEYEPIGRIAVFIGLLAFAGAMIFVLVDLGRPEKFWRLFMYGYQNNMTSLFAINSIWYGGYLLLMVVYLWLAMENKAKLAATIGTIDIVWAIGVHSFTGGIFGLISTREIFSSPLKPFEFIAAALTSGT
ncbi:MAG: NrfD/PsrC family molybdoenzyme membrane anchor subunit, partial [Methanobacteriota archaeon]